MTAILLRKTAKLHANNARRCSKAKEKKRRSVGLCPTPPQPLKRLTKLLNCLSLSQLATAGETSPLPAASVGVRRVKPLLRNRPAALPRKTPYYKVFAGPFSKGRVPHAFPSRPHAFPFPAPRFSVPRRHCALFFSSRPIVTKQNFICSHISR